MKAAQLVGLRELNVAEVAAPCINGDKDVLVNVRAVGICGSDVHNYVEGGIGARKVIYPFIPGHEAVGEVAEVGSGVTKVKPGDRIMIEPAFHCGECDQCMAGRFNTCRNIQFMSSAGEIQGCMCEQVVIPEQNCFIIPDSLSFAQAAVAEPLSIAIHSVNQSIAISEQTPIAILGAGPVGLCTLLAAQSKGGCRIYVSDKINERLQVAEKLGAAWTGNPDKNDIVKAIAEAEPLGIDVVFECSGDAAALDQAVELLAPGGRLVITGIPIGSRISLNIDQLRRKEITVQNVRRQNCTVEETIRLLADGDINVDGLITHKMPLAEAKAAFDLVAGYEDGVVKAMVVV